MEKVVVKHNTYDGLSMNEESQQNDIDGEGNDGINDGDINNVAINNLIAGDIDISYNGEADAGEVDENNMEEGAGVDTTRKNNVEIDDIDPRLDL